MDIMTKSVIIYHIYIVFPLVPQSLQGEMAGHQTAVETLRKTSDLLMSCEGELLSHPEEIQETVGEGACKHQSAHDAALRVYGLPQWTPH